MKNGLKMLPQRSLAALGLAAAFGGLAVTQAAAMPISYQLQIDVNDENSPILTLENTSATESLTAFQFTIGDTGFWFDQVFLFEPGTSDPGGDLSVVLLSPSPNVQNDRLDTDLLSMTFTGFDPGDVLVLELELDADGNNGNVRDPVFFDNGAAPNSQITTDFGDGTQLVTVLPENPAAPGGVVTINQSPTPTQQISEPRSLGLFGLGLLGLGATIRRRRGSKF